MGSIASLQKPGLLSHGGLAMCGICGRFNFKTARPADLATVRSMAATMLHRGPNDDGYHVDGEMAIGMRRLSIIDIAGGGQPMTGENGTVWVISNGEIYNFHDLRRELESHGHAFRSRSDTEVIVHAYEQWGVDFLERLNGMFGLALWDSSNRTLIVARDPYGIKPIYWRETTDGLAFASEVRPLLLSAEGPSRVDLVGLDEFLALGYVPSPRTAFADIAKLAPGHALLCRAGGISQFRFHRRPPNQMTNLRDDDLLDLLRDAIATAVRRQMVADVPVGLMLSGGMDSSTIAVLMARFSDRPIKTFTVGFEGEFAENEFEPARRVARTIGADHHELAISAADYESFLPQSIASLEEPIATTSTLPFFKLCGLARSEVTVALSGQGADEPFAGYRRYMGEHLGSIYRAIPGPARNMLLSRAVGLLPRSEHIHRGIAALGESDPRRRLSRVEFISDSALRRRLYRDAGLAASEDVHSVATWYGDVEKLDPLSRMLYVDARMGLSDDLLMYADKLSMAVSLEMRVPFLDLELMDLAESIPSELKIKMRNQKHILKRAVRDWIPEVVTRKKVGFSTPIDGWLRNELGPAVRNRLLDPSSACSEYFQSAVIEELIDDHRRGRRDYKRILFSLLTFEIWHETFMRQRIPTAA